MAEKPKPSPFDENHPGGEFPPDVSQMPGAVYLDSNPTPKGLRERAEQFLDKHPVIKRKAQRAKKDIIAITSTSGGRLLIGAGIATTIGGIVLYERKKRKRKEKKKE